MATTLYLNRINYYGYSLLFICLVMAEMYYHNEVVNKRTFQWLAFYEAFWYYLGTDVSRNLTVQALKKEVMTQIEEIRYGKRRYYHKGNYQGKRYS